MSKVNRRFRLLSILLVLSLLLFPVFGFGSNGFTSAEQNQVEKILKEKYTNLPSVKFDFSDQPDATYEDLVFRSYNNLAISVPNLIDGILVGIFTYENTNYLLMAVELPGEMDADYGAGLIDHSEDKAVFAAKAELSTQEESIDQIRFDLTPVGEDSSNLHFVVQGRKYSLKTTVPKSL